MAMPYSKRTMFQDRACVGLGARRGVYDGAFECYVHYRYSTVLQRVAKGSWVWHKHKNENRGVPVRNILPTSRAKRVI